MRWGDIDLLGHVNNINYLQYFETARVEYLMRAGMEAPGEAWREFGFILASVDCRYKAPVTFPDTLSVGARVSALGEDRLVFQHAAYSHKLDRLAAIGEAFVVAYDYSAGRRTAIPADLRASLRRPRGQRAASAAPLPRKGGASRERTLFTQCLSPRQRDRKTPRPYARSTERLSIVTLRLDLVDALRAANAVTLSAVAVLDATRLDPEEPAHAAQDNMSGDGLVGGEVVGHALFTPVLVATARG